MRHLFLWSMVLFAWFAAGCPEGKYDNLQNASETDKKAAEELWNSYLKALGNRQVSKDPVRVASFFSRSLIASTSRLDFSKRIKKCLGRRSGGAFENVDVEALKTGSDGLLLIVDSKAGQAAIPVMKEGDHIKFAELLASTGDWTTQAKHGPSQMPQVPTLLYIEMMLTDKKAPVGDRLRAALQLAEKKYRREIIANQRRVEDPIVRLGLGLARIKIDGSDESFLRNFPTNASGISAIHQADEKIFEEMITKLSNLGAMIEDPPANEVLYKVVAGAPASMKERMGKALYHMAELNPGRFANAVRNLARDMEKDTALGIYLEEVKRRGGQAPKMMKFLKKFSRIGEFEERKLCKSLMARISKAK